MLKFQGYLGDGAQRLSFLALLKLMNMIFFQMPEKSFKQSGSGSSILKIQVFVMEL